MIVVFFGLLFFSSLAHASSTECLIRVLREPIDYRGGIGGVPADVRLVSVKRYDQGQVAYVFEAKTEQIIEWGKTQYRGGTTVSGDHGNPQRAFDGVLEVSEEGDFVYPAVRLKLEKLGFKFGTVEYEHGGQKYRYYYAQEVPNGELAEKKRLEHNAKVNESQQIDIGIYSTRGEVSTEEYVRNWVEDAALPFSKPVSEDSGWIFFHDRYFHYSGVMYIPKEITAPGRRFGKLILEKFPQYLEKFADEIDNYIGRL